MNTISKISLAAAVAAAFTVINSSQADNAFRSPKAVDLQIRTVAGVAQDPDLAHPAAPKVLWSPRAAGNHVQAVTSTAAQDPDLAHSTGFAPGGSSIAREVYAQQVKALSLKEFELAPLK